MVKKVPQMILRIGNKKNFTFIEIMLATIFLSLSSILIYSSLFLILDTFKYYQAYLYAINFINEKMWLVSNNLSRFGRLNNIDTEGIFNIDNLKAKWNLSYFLENETKDKRFYEIDFYLKMEGRRPLNIKRISYAIFKK